MVACDENHRASSAGGLFVGAAARSGASGRVAVGRGAPTISMPGVEVPRDRVAAPPQATATPRPSAVVDPRIGDFGRRSLPWRTVVSSRIAFGSQHSGQATSS